MLNHLQAYVKYLKHFRADSSIQTYEYNCTKFVEWLQENNYPDSEAVSQNTLLEYVDHMKEKGLKPATIEIYMVSIFKFTEFLEEREIINKKPFKSFKDMKKFLPIIEKKQIRTLSKDQLKTIARNVENDAYRNALLHFMFDTATRVSEIVKAKWSDIEEGDGVYILTVYGKGKGGFSKKRFVNISPSTHKKLMELRKLNFSEYIFASTYNFKQVSERRMNQIVSRMVNDIGVTNANVHTFRKTAATNLFENGMPIEHLSRYLGHDSVSTTLKYYIDLDRSMAEQFNKYYTAF